MKLLFPGILGRIILVCVLTLTATVQIQASEQLSAQAKSANAPQRKPEAYKWWQDSDPRGHTIYFYDKEMRNGAVTAHMWYRDTTLADDGVTVTGTEDIPMYEWDKRKRMEFTGKKIEIDGQYYPVYKYLFYCQNSSPYDDPYADAWNAATMTAPTHLLIRHEDSVASKCESTADLEFVDNALYGFDGVRIEDFDESDLVDVTDDDFTKYVVYLTGSPDKYEQYIQYMSNYITVHVWGPDGDLSPWAFNGTCSFIDENPAISSSNYKVWTEDFGYTSVIKYEFYYHGATPTGIIFKYKRSPDDWDHQTTDLTFCDGALYTIGDVNHYCDPIENPEISDSIPEIEGDFYVIDTDCLYRYDYNEQTGHYSLSSDVWGQFSFERSPSAQYMSDLPVTIETRDADIKFTRLGNYWYPVIKVSLGTQYSKVSGKISKIRLSVNRYYDGQRTSGWMDFSIGNVYYFAGAGAVHAPLKYDDLTLYDSIPEENPVKKTIYVHLGANQIMEKELWKVPYCIPYRRIPGSDPAEAIYSSEYTLPRQPVNFPQYTDPSSAEYSDSELKKYEMTCVSPGLYKFEVDNIYDYDDFVCFYWAHEQIVTKYEYITQDEFYNDYTKYSALGVEYDYDTNQYRYPVEWGLGDAMRMTELTASRSLYYDPVHWDDYVYDIGVDCFHQSYLTPQQYFAVEDMIEKNNIHSIYLVGNEPVSGAPMGDPSASREITEDHGCFFFDFEVTEDMPASFKASVVNVPGIIDRLTPGAYVPQRGWASFNLGLIGPHKDINDEDYDEWYASHVTQGGKSREICIRTDETYAYNNYSQYHWRIEADSDHGMQPGHYYMVFDLLEEDRTVTVLDFDPHPHCYVNDIAIRVLDVDADRAEELHDGHYLDGSRHSGKVLFDKVNVASGTINVGDTDNTLIGKEGYEVVYTIYVDDRIAYIQDKMTTEGRPEAIVADYLDLSADVRYAVRGRYHDLKTDRYFASKQEEEGISSLIDQLPAPSVNVEAKSLMFYMSGADHKEIALGAAANLSYFVDTPIDYDIEYLADYEVTGATLDGNPVDNISAPLIHQDHYIVTHGANPWSSYLGTPDNPWLIHDGVSSLTEANNWSNHIRRTNRIPVLIDRMRLYEENKVPKATATADYSIHAVYPFLATDFEAKTVIVPDQKNHAPAVQVKPAAVDSQSAGIPANLDEYKLVRVKSSTPVHIDFDNDVVTGVENIIDNGTPDSAPAEYFNLQGMRIDADNLVPGIYIERKGTTTRKILVN